MGIESTLAAVKSFVKTQLSFTDNNCSVGDEAVFTYIQTVAGAPTKCCVIDYGGFEALDSSEFASLTVNWKVDINTFFSVNQYSIPAALTLGRQYVDSLLMAITNDPMLGGAVSFAKPTEGQELISYTRGNFDYVYAYVQLTIMENIS